MFAVLIPAILLGFLSPSQAPVPPSNDSALLYVQNIPSLLQLKEKTEKMDKNVNLSQLPDKLTDNDKNSQLPKNGKGKIPLKFKGIDQINEILGKSKVTNGKNKISIKEPKFKDVETWNQSVEVTTTNITYNGTWDVNLTTTTDNVQSKETDARMPGPGMENRNRDDALSPLSIYILLIFTLIVIKVDF